MCKALYFSSGTLRNCTAFDTFQPTKEAIVELPDIGAAKILLARVLGQNVDGELVCVQHCPALVGLPPCPRRHLYALIILFHLHNIKQQHSTTREKRTKRFVRDEIMEIPRALSMPSFNYDRMEDVKTRSKSMALRRTCTSKIHSHTPLSTGPIVSKKIGAAPRFRLLPRLVSSRGGPRGKVNGFRTSSSAGSISGDLESSACNACRVGEAPSGRGLSFARGRSCGCDVPPSLS
jgi:hypothetical protein